MNENLQQQLIKELLVECLEGLDHYDRDLVALEAGDRSEDTLKGVFRIIHNIKGTTGCVGFSRIETLAHAGENLLSLIRDGKVAVSSEIISALLKLSDALRGMFSELERTGKDSTADNAELLAQLIELQHSKPDEKASMVPKTEVAAPTTVKLPDNEASQPTTLPSVFAEAGSPETARTSATADASRGSISDSAIRVDVVQLDRLMNLVGELVLARNQIVQHTGNTQETALLTAAQRLNLITTELQESVMKTRMQPIGNVWSRFPRIVRDVAHDVGKQVRIEMVGNETELDRTIIEAIKDPLTHIIRNSIDHGIEKPHTRTRAGKDAEGCILMRAYHEGGQVNIEITDDGAGINIERVKQKAIERGIITSEQSARLTEREALNLIFHAGLSTAEKVTNVSGRGVGMDVVRTNIEKIGGSIDIQSQAGQSTTLKIKIPLTLAIIPALIVTSGGERYAIPQVSLVELVRLDAAGEHRGVEHVFGAPVYRLRGKLLPLVYLNQVLKSDAQPNDAASAANVVVLQADGSQFGLVVDEINDTQEIVVKPLGKHLKGIPVFAGATIMGDGHVALILDVLGLANSARAILDSPAHKEDAVTQRSNDGSQRLLIFKLGTSNRMCVPLSTVGRLERIPASSLEREGLKEVVQYRGAIMPLVRLDGIIGSDGPSTPQTELPVVVYSRNNRNVGVVVGEIVDVVEETVTLEKRDCRRGVLGSAVIQGRVTELLDVPSLLAEFETNTSTHHS